MEQHLCTLRASLWLCRSKALALGLCPRCWTWTCWMRSSWCPPRTAWSWRGAWPSKRASCAVSPRAPPWWPPSGEPLLLCYLQLSDSALPAASCRKLKPEAFPLCTATSSIHCQLIMHAKIHRAVIYTVEIELAQRTCAVCLWLLVCVRGVTGVGGGLAGWHSGRKTRASLWLWCCHLSASATCRQSCSTTSGPRHGLSCLAAFAMSAKKA